MNDYKLSSNKRFGQGGTMIYTVTWKIVVFDEWGDLENTIRQRSFKIKVDTPALAKDMAIDECQTRTNHAFSKKTNGQFIPRIVTLVDNDGVCHKC
jgi:hypothetical protein